MKTKNEAGQLGVNLSIVLGSYTAEPVSVELRDGDSPTIARQGVGALPPKGKAPFKSGRLKSASKTGITQVQLKSRGAGIFKINVKAKRWFSAAAANQPAGSTDLTLRIGTQCFRATATAKSD